MDEPVGAGDPTVVIGALEQLLVAEGPLQVEQLAERLEASSPQLAADLVADRGAIDVLAAVTSLTRQSDVFWRIPDGRLAPVLHHLRRATFTHRLTDEELERGAIDLCPDLLALALPRSVQLGDGTELTVAGPQTDARAAESGSVFGPEGWLAQYVAGDLLAVGYDGEKVRLEPISADALDASAGQAVAEALQSTFARLPRDRAPEVHRLVVDTMGLHPASFTTAVAPVAELLATVGLGVRGVWVGPVDRPWATPPEQARRRRLDEVVDAADPCCRQSAHRAHDAWQTWLRSADDAGERTFSPAVAARLVEDLDHGPSAVLLARVAPLDHPVPQLQALGEWAEALATASGKSTAALAMLQAVGAEAADDALAAEEHLRRGLELEDSNYGCVELLSELVEDRGDARQSVTLLRRLPRPPRPDALELLEPFLGAREIGRNDPCPCGSGRKFKACCYGRTIKRPLIDRSRWLLAKAGRHAVRRNPALLQSLHQLFGGAYGGEDLGRLIADQMLFSHDGLANYLEARGALLPEDELACARAWPDQPLRMLDPVVNAESNLEVKLSPYAVTFDVLDVATGQRLTVVDSVNFPLLAGADTVIARPLPVGDRWIMSSAVISVPETSRDQALEMLEGEGQLGPMQLLHLLVDLQVAAIKR